MEETLSFRDEASPRQNFISGAKACLPTVFGYLSIGFAAGVLARTAGLSVTETGLLSLLMYAGSGQFVAVGMVAAGSAISSIIFTIFLVNLRHLLFSASLAPYCRDMPQWKNVLIGSQITDETFGVASNELSGREKANFAWMMGVNITAYTNWFLANILGALLGGVVTDTKAIGMDFALPAMFAGLLTLQLLGNKSYLLYITVAGFTILALIAVNAVLPGVWGVMIATLLGATFGLVVTKWM